MGKKKFLCMILFAALAVSLPISGKALSIFDAADLDAVTKDLGVEQSDKLLSIEWESETEKQSDQEIEKVIQIDQERLHYDVNQSCLKNGIVGDYFIDLSGNRVKNAWVYRNGKRIFLGADGNQIQDFQGGWHRIGKNEYYYTEQGELKKGWLNLNGKDYYLDERTGIRAGGWRESKEERYYFSPKTGEMVVDEWVGEWYVGSTGAVSARRPKAALIPMKTILQNPELPTGCESVALSIVLKYYGFPVLKTTIADKYLEYSSKNFVSAFVGNPRAKSGAGCFAPAIVKAANKYLKEQDSGLRAEDLTGKSLSELYSYVSVGKPVLVWNTMYMAQPEKTGTTYVENGKTYSWFRKEHCVVLCGYDTEKETVTVNDPLEGIVVRDAEDFEDIYNQMGQMAVLLQE